MRGSLAATWAGLDAESAEPTAAFRRTWKRRLIPSGSLWLGILLGSSGLALRLSQRIQKAAAL